MYEFAAFAATVVLVSVSGVMSPGPLFVANMFYGMRAGWRAGLRVAAGHAVVELPLVTMLGAGVITLESATHFHTVAAAVGAAGLFVFAGLQIREAVGGGGRGWGGWGTGGTGGRYGPFVAGVVLSGLNPFFLIWWFTIGVKLISDAMALWPGYGMLVMFGLHIWMDFAWLGATAFLASRGGRLLSERSRRVIGVAVGGLLVYFGASFIVKLLATV